MVRKSNLAWLWLTLIIIIIDQISKYWALKSLVYGVPKFILPFFNLTLLFNRGVAFSFLNQGGSVSTWTFMIVSLIISVIILFWLVRLPAKNNWLACALTLVLGGALGNLIDRVFRGYVIDFIQLHVGHWYWPIFNLADSAITIGAIMIVIDIFRNKPATVTPKANK